MIEFINDTETVLNYSEAEVVRVLTLVAEENKHSIEALNIIFMSDDALLEINKEYLQHDYYTDIITFDYSETEKVVNGELYISIDRVRDNAQMEGVVFLHELFRVMIHGVLHLVGYGDKTESEQEVMRKQEDQYLKGVCFT